MPKIDFEFDTKFGKYADALWFPDDQPLPTDEEIEAMKAQRRDGWVALVESASVEPPVEETAPEETAPEETSEPAVEEQPPASEE